jgi:hypothetical protein
MTSLPWRERIVSNLGGKARRVAGTLLSKLVERTPKRLRDPLKRQQTPY